MNDKLKAAYAKYIEASAEKKRLEKTIEECRAAIVAQHRDVDSKLICEDGYKSELIPAVTKKLQIKCVDAKFDAIEKKFGIVLDPSDRVTDDCYSRTSYERLVVSPLIVEG